MKRMTYNMGVSVLTSAKKAPEIVNMGNVIRVKYCAQTDFSGECEGSFYCDQQLWKSKASQLMILRLLAICHASMMEGTLCERLKVY